MHAVEAVGDHKRVSLQCSTVPALCSVPLQPYKRTTKPLRYFGFDKKRRRRQRRRLSYLEQNTAKHTLKNAFTVKLNQFQSISFTTCL